MAVTARRALAALLDRPGGRRLLASAATRWARYVTRDNRIGVLYDDMWIDAIDGLYLPRGKAFDYYRFDFERMRRFTQERLAGSLDYWTHVYQPRSGDVVIDVGAGIGVDALVLSPLVGPSGRIYSLEAHPWTFQAFLKTCYANCLANVIPYHLAASDMPGTLWISDEANNEENTVSKCAGSTHPIPVEAVALDKFVADRQLGRIALLKMNIEGSEQIAIQGMNRCIDQIDHVVIACHDFRDFRTKELVTVFLRSHGFDVIERNDDPRPYVRDHVHGIRVRS